MTAPGRRARRRQRAWDPPLVVETRPGSPCDGKVRPGDRLLEIDGIKPRDIFDYMEAGERERVSLRIARGGREKTLRLRKGTGVPLGLVFETAVFDGVRSCRNRCIFCFVDQMPPGLRPGLYVRDDDYRLSFYHGNFITLNNLSGADLDRIKRLRLSPLYVSLHSSDEVLRRRMMGGNAARGLSALAALREHGIEVHLQVVVCPGYNDGDELRRTLRDALRRYGASSLAVVPVGLTSQALALRHTLTPHDRVSAAEVLDMVEEFQELALEERGRRTFFAADEFYLLAGRDLPPASEYDDYPQLDNGVGMARKFLEEVREASPHEEERAGGRRGVLTGAAGAEVLPHALEEAGLRDVEVVTVPNLLFGPAVTVTALLGGADIAAALRAADATSYELLIPDSMLDEGLFIDGHNPAEVERATGRRLVPVAVDGGAFVRALRGREGR